MTSTEPAVLEHLAASGWFARHGEVALTSGLTFCLKKDPRAADRVVELLRQRTGLGEAEIPVPTRWAVEVVFDRTRRVDVIGFLGDGVSRAPVIFMEAKVGALLGPGQVSEYVDSQQRALNGAGLGCGVLVVLVPAARVRSVRDEIAGDLGRLEVITSVDGWRVEHECTIHVTIISWEDIFDTMLEAGGVVAEDVTQLQGALRALQGIFVPALSETDLAGGWRQREDIWMIVDRVTRAATERLALPLAPWQPNPSGGLRGGFRYLAPPAPLPSTAVGVRSDGNDPPIWLRWHNATPGFDRIASRLAAAGFESESYADHLWVPLHVEPATAGIQLEALTAQVFSLHQIVADSSTV